MRVSQQAHRASLLTANAAVMRRIRDTLAGVGPEAMVRRPASGGWSVAEVLEHLIVSADSYLEPMRALIEGNAGGAVNPASTWKPSLMGGMLAASLRGTRKLPAPKRYTPGPSPRPRVLEEFFRRQEEAGRLITEAGGLDWRRVRMRSPVAPILRMNLGDAFTILVVHAERHAGQIERVLKVVEHRGMRSER